MDKGLIDWNEVLDKVMNAQLNTARHNDWEMKGLSNGHKILVLDYLKKYFVKIEDYELCNEIQIQLDKIQSVSNNTISKLKM
jgi:hypothetical protein